MLSAPFENASNSTKVPSVGTFFEISYGYVRQKLTSCSSDLIVRVMDVELYGTVKQMSQRREIETLRDRIQQICDQLKQHLHPQ